MYTNSWNYRWSTANSHSSGTIHFRKKWWTNELGGLNVYTLLIVYYICTGKLAQVYHDLQIKRWPINMNSVLPYIVSIGVSHGSARAKT